MVLQVPVTTACPDCHLPVDEKTGEKCGHAPMCCDCFDQGWGMPLSGRTRARPTHRCKACGALWKLHEAAQPSWQCCDNVAMDEQMEALC